MGTLKLLLRKAHGLDSADLNGFSDPYVILQCAGQSRKSSIKPKTLNPVWNEEFEFGDFSMAELVASGLALTVYDCDNPARPDKDDSLGETHISLRWMRGEDGKDYVAEPLPTKGTLTFDLRWELPPEPEPEGGAASTVLVVGDERTVVGSTPLILREGVETDSKAIMNLPPETRIQVHEVVPAKNEDGVMRANVRVLAMPNGASPASQLAAAAAAATTTTATTTTSPAAEGGDASATASTADAAAGGGGASAAPAATAASSASATSAAPASFPAAAAASVVADVCGWVTSVHGDGRRRLAKRHHRVDTHEKWKQTELWNRRMSADKAEEKVKLSRNAMASSGSGSGGGGGKGGDHHHGSRGVGPSYKHEVLDDEAGIAFGYGGLFPGTLHARGQLVKTHTVSYSVGCAGKYLLHVGLRQKAHILPGSPFVLEVRPGPAHALSTIIDPERLPLETIVGTDGQLRLKMCDKMGNRCIEGGAPLQVSIAPTRSRA